VLIELACVGNGGQGFDTQGQIACIWAPKKGILITFRFISYVS